MPGIKGWPEGERPRERLMRLGSESLTDAELLAIILGSGCRGMSALDVAREIINDAGSLSALLEKDYSFFKKYRGVGEQKGAIVHAVLEIARRIHQPVQGESTLIQSPEDVARLFMTRLRGISQERFYVLLLNSANKLIRDIEISRGILNSSLVHPRETFKLAVMENAASIIVVHNHPSGNAEPSEEDIAITKQLVSSGRIIGIPVQDHIIIAGETFTSLAQRNQI